MIHGQVLEAYKKLVEDAQAVIPVLREKMAAAVTAQDVEACIEIAEDFIRLSAGVCRAQHATTRSRVALPGFEVMSLYCGYSEFLGSRMKLGITQNIKNRQKSIRHTMSFLGLPPDFCMLDYVSGEANYVKSIEKLALIELAQHRQGGEWFADTVEFHDWFSEVAPGITDSLVVAVEKIDIESQIQEAKTPVLSMFKGLYGARDVRLAGLENLWVSWNKALISLDEEQKQRTRAADKNLDEGQGKAEVKA